jgi:polysaccharide export outer membrane protein
MDSFQYLQIQFATLREVLLRLIVRVNSWVRLIAARVWFLEVLVPFFESSSRPVARFRCAGGDPEPIASGGRLVSIVRGSGRLRLQSPRPGLTPVSIGAALILSACAGTVTQSTLKVDVKVLDALHRYERVYVLQPGDEIEVFLYRHPEFSRKVIVRSDGMISLPLIGEVKAVGVPPKEFSETLDQLYGQRIRNPEITVLVDNPPDPMVYVLGSVGAPKAISFRQARTVAQALAQSGDVLKTGSFESIAIIRLNDTGFLEAHTVQSDGWNQPKTYMALQNMPLEPNDVILVPESYRGQLMRVLQDVNTALSPFYEIRLLQIISTN